MPFNKSNLVADLKEMLLAAFELGDYAKVQKFAGYLAEFSGEKAASKPENKPATKRGPKPKAKKAAKRGAAKFPVGTKLRTSLKGIDYTIEVKMNGYEYEGELFSALSRVIDKAFGKGKAMHLRNFANWKVVV